MDQSQRPTEWVEDPTGVPRYLADHQPPSKRDTFRSLYPSGLPIMYPMQYVESPYDVPQVYIENNLPMIFYTSKPSHVRGIFSTGDEHRPWRTPPEILLVRCIHLWSKDEVQAICNSIRKIWWAYMKVMPAPYSWDDLLLYFDAHDIYNYGALNLWNVIKTLHHENVIILEDYQKLAAAEVGYWVDTWLEVPHNRKKLESWNESHEHPFSLMSAEDWTSLGNIDDFDRAALESALSYRREVITGSLVTRKPKDLLSVFFSGFLQNWLGMSK